MRSTCEKPNCGRPVFGRKLCQRHYEHAKYHGLLPEQPPPRPCEQCGEVFTGRKWNARYCSRKCCDQARYDRKKRAPYYGPGTCEWCSAELPERRRIDMRFCSESCGDNHRNAQRSKELLAAKAAAPRPCQGCTQPIPPERTVSALYCSEACKIRSRRHEAYGLTRQELGVLLAQHEQCAICRSGDWGVKGPQVDHCHRTGRVRGVLCNNCNNGLGRFGDDPARLRAAAAYLEVAMT